MPKCMLLNEPQPLAPCTPGTLAAGGFAPGAPPSLDWCLSCNMHAATGPLACCRGTDIVDTQWLHACCSRQCRRCHSLQRWRADSQYLHTHLLQMQPSPKCETSGELWIRCIPAHQHSCSQTPPISPRRPAALLHRTCRTWLNMCTALPASARHSLRTCAAGSIPFAWLAAGMAWPGETTGGICWSLRVSLPIGSCNCSMSRM